jgi:hypothetical protein
MNLRHSLAVTAALATLTATSLTAQWPATEKLDLDAIYRLKEEGFQRSKVMEIESYLTDVYGPRLTGSPNIREAADWAQKTMRDWGSQRAPRDVSVRTRLGQQAIRGERDDAPRLSADRVSEGVDAWHQRAGDR